MGADILWRKDYGRRCTRADNVSHQVLAKVNVVFYCPHWYFAKFKFWLTLCLPSFLHYTLYTLLNIEVQPHVQTMFLIKFLPKVILTFYCPLWYFQNEGSDLIFDLLFVIDTFEQSNLADIFNTFKCTCTRADNVSHQVLAKSHCDLLLSTLDIFKIKVPITSWNLKFSKWIFQLQPSQILLGKPT